ncbi:MAG: RHS repeat-associated core domain-containing protein [Caldilineaceae bacterium]
MGDTALAATSSGGLSTDEKYYAYGRAQWAPGDSGPVVTDHKFTGQKLDSTGLYYYNARYYDPEIGQFISPDTLVPDPTDLFDYNRYMYSRGNPLKFVDPTGHCADSIMAETEYDNADCWRFANTILNMWDDTDYWSSRFTSKDVFLKVATDITNGTDFFQAQFDFFFQSEEGKQWLGGDQHSFQPPEQDFGDYTSFNGSMGMYDVAFIIDDFGNVYFRLGPGAGTPGVSVRRGDVLVEQSGGLGAKDIDQLGLTRKEKSDLMQELMPGVSEGVGGGIIYTSVSVSANLSPPFATFVESGVTGPFPVSWGFAPISRTWYLFSLSK